MRLSTLRFKKFRLSKHQSFRLLAVAIASGLWAFPSCRVRDTTPASVMTPQLPASPQGTQQGLSPEALVFRLQGKQEFMDVAQMDYQHCLDPKSPERWRIRFKSPFGSHEAKIDFSGAENGEGTRAQIDGFAYRVNMMPPWNAKELTAACESQGMQPGQISVAPEMIEPIRLLLQGLGPNCQFAFQDGGWQCLIGQQSLGLINTKLSEIRASMMARWSRHPYILTRRVALAVEVGAALALPNAGERTKELDRICRLMTTQIPAELPLSFRSAATQQAMCINPGESRLSATQAALDEALAEVGSLRTKLENSSHLGTLTVKIPNAGAHGRELWVSLIPISDTSLKGPLTVNPDAALAACWHPIYGATDDMASVALDLGLLDRARAATCQSLNQSSKTPSIFDNYVLNSVASETEFSVSNGVPKLLRMPPGDYNYAIRVPLDFVEGNEQDSERPRAAGIISWKSRRPAPLIIQW